MSADVAAVVSALGFAGIACFRSVDVGELPVAASIVQGATHGWVAAVTPILLGAPITRPNDPVGEVRC